MKIWSGPNRRKPAAHGYARFCGAMVVAMLFALSAPAWGQSQRDAVCQGSCGGGCGPCSAPPTRVAREPRGPTEAEVAAEAKREQAMAINDNAVAAFYREDYTAAKQLYLRYLELYPKNEIIRNNVALVENAIGWGFYKRGDYVSALACFQRAAEIQKHLKQPSHTDGVQENLALALKALSLEQQNEDNKNASSKIQGIVDNFSKSDGQLSTPNKLTFDDFGGSAPANTSKSAFGSNVANPKLEASPTPPAKVGSNTKSGDQLMSAANTAKHDGDLTANYDAGTATTAGSLVFQKSSIDLSTYSERARKDPQVIAALMELESLQAKRSQLERERDELVKQRNAAMDKTAMDKATAELDRKEKEYQDNVAVISQKSKDLEKRHREIDAEVQSTKANEKRPSGER